MPKDPPPLNDLGPDPIAAAFRDVWNAFRGLFRDQPDDDDKYRIIHVEGFGYVAQVRDAGRGWDALRPSGASSGLPYPNFLDFKESYACRTEAEAGARINRREAEHRVVWEG